MIEITVLGDPKAQKRHRHARMGNFIKVYDPSKADKGDFLSIVQRHAPEKPFDCPLRVDVSFYFSRPKNHYGTGKNAGVLKATAPEWYTSKPDRDNLDKKILDSMCKIFWRDDSIICAGELTKKYSENPRTEIKITLL